jgi:RNA polymerase sigma-70 factor (ECF subfamily)
MPGPDLAFLASWRFKRPCTFCDFSVKVVAGADSKNERETDPMATLAATCPTPPAAVTPAPRATDGDLIAACVGGDGEAARELHVRYHAVASAFLRKLGTGPGELEDACQEVFLRFFRYLPSFRGDAELKTWLYRLCITEARRARRRRSIGRVLEVLLIQRHSDDSEQVPAAARSDATLAGLCGTALDRMGEGLRLCFVLYEMEGLSGKQIAEIAGCPEATVWRRLHDARRLFRAALDAEPAESASAKTQASARARDEARSEG